MSASPTQKLLRGLSLDSRVKPGQGSAPWAKPIVMLAAVLKAPARVVRGSARLLAR